MADLKNLEDLVQALRGPDGCPWDRSRKLSDMKQYLLEECYEVMEAIDPPAYDKLQEELGDLLFHIIFIASMAQEAGHFGLADVIEGIRRKMVRRHPHVFGTASAQDPEAVRRRWWRIKLREGATPGGSLEAIPKHLPALQRAYRLGQRASQVGLDWPEPRPVLDKIKEEVVELEDALSHGPGQAIEEEIGDLIFSIANLARLLHLNPEEALQRSNDKFVERFRRMEERARAGNRSLEDLSTHEMDRLWNEVKEEG